MFLVLEAVLPGLPLSREFTHMCCSSHLLVILCLVKINLAVSISVLTCIVAQSLPIGFPYYQFPTVEENTIGKKEENFKIKFLFFSPLAYCHIMLVIKITCFFTPSGIL